MAQIGIVYVTLVHLVLHDFTYSMLNLPQHVLMWSTLASTFPYKMEQPQCRCDCYWHPHYDLSGFSPNIPTADCLMMHWPKCAYKCCSVHAHALYHCLYSHDKHLSISDLFPQLSFTVLSGADSLKLTLQRLTTIIHESIISYRDLVVMVLSLIGWFCVDCHWDTHRLQLYTS